MATITDRHGNVIREEPDTLEDWKQAAEVEAGIRREFQAKCEMLKMTLGGVLKEFAKSNDYRPDSVMIRNALAMLSE